MGRADDKPFVPTVDRTFRILEALALSENGYGISELSQNLEIPKSTTFNILMTLINLGYIYRTDSDNKFHLSLKLFTLGSLVVERMDLRQLARPILQELVDETGETVNLGTIQGDEAVYIECIPGPQPVTVNTWPGKRLPLHTTALGKVLLAWLTENEANAILSSVYSQISPKESRALRDQLSIVRQQQYAIDDEEDVPGMRCVGSPIFDHSGQVVAAISLTAPVQRMPIEDIPKKAVLVVDIARRISRLIGFAPEIHD